VGRGGKGEGLNVMHVAHPPPPAAAPNNNAPSTYSNHSFRRVKPPYSTAADDRASKLRLYDFPLNTELTGVCRAVELPSGRQVNEYPVVNAHMAEVFQTLCSAQVAAVPTIAAAAAAQMNPLG